MNKSNSSIKTISCEACAEPTPPSRKPSFHSTYKPLLVIIIFVLLVSGAHQIRLRVFDPHVLMNHLMGGFFSTLSFFKFLDLEAFAKSFSSYDPIAKRFPIYGWIYPWFEFFIGLMFIGNLAVFIANLLAIFALAITTVGVFLKLRSKEKIHCACLGTAFNLPLSEVTIVENILMILMAILGIVLLA